MVLAFSLTCVQALAQDLITERALFKDLHGDLTLAQVQQVPFTKTGPVVSQGYTPATIWLRFTVNAPPDQPTLVLRIFPSLLGDITLFSPDVASTDPLTHDQLSQPLQARTTRIDSTPGEKIYYLRLKTTGVLFLEARVMTLEHAHQEDIRRGVVLGAILACCFALMSSLLVLIALRRELLHSLFLLHFTVSVVVFFSWHGYTTYLFGSDSWMNPRNTFNLLLIINIFTGLLFFRALLGRFNLPAWGRSVFSLFFILYLSLFLLFFVLDQQRILSYCMWIGVVACVLFIPLTAVVFYHQKSTTWLIGGIIFVALVLLLRSILILQGAVAPDDSIINIMAFRVFFLAGFFSIMLLLIEREKKSLLQTLTLNATVARQFAQSEKNRRETQERFMTMLMHELKTPLSIIQLAATSLGRRLLPGCADTTRLKNIQRSVDDLNAIIERCVQADQIDQGTALLNKQLFTVQSLTDDLLTTFDTRRISLISDPAQTVFSDYQYTRLILQNLMSNALKYSPVDSLIELHIQTLHIKNATCVQFVVSNTVGPAGLPDPERIFTRYYRSEAARQYVGAGLGLWLAQAVAQQLGSQVNFQIAQDKVSFNFELASA